MLCVIRYLDTPRPVGLLRTSYQLVEEAATWTTHNAHKTRTSMPSSVFKPTIQANDRSQTFALDHKTTGITTDLQNSMGCKTGGTVSLNPLSDDGASHRGATPPAAVGLTSRDARPVAKCTVSLTAPLLNVQYH
jgi:hypothetical protein